MDATPAEQQFLDTDPWESFNSKMFRFNHRALDRYLLKPAAWAWDWALPNPVQKGLANAVDSSNFVLRLLTIRPLSSYVPYSGSFTRSVNAPD